MRSFCLVDMMCPQGTKLRKANFFNLKREQCSNALQIQIGIDPLRGGEEEEGEGWVDDKGQRRCVLHSPIPFVKEANMHSILTGTKGEWGTRCRVKHFSLLMQTNCSLSPRTIITWGERGSMCVRGRDAYTGADLERAWPIDRIKLPAKERNQYVFKGEAGCMWRMRVGFIDTARRVQWKAVPEKERSHFEVKWFHFQCLSTKSGLVRNYLHEKCACLRVRSFEQCHCGFPLSLQNAHHCWRSTNHTKSEVFRWRKFLISCVVWQEKSKIKNKGRPVTLRDT